ncbi:hypothetical protein DL767_007039 [Monosporascus sp. MG133]|nr:hypothetical protein DL767_007039 [Monosporascus sp. MG133]
MAPHVLRPSPPKCQDRTIGVKPCRRSQTPPQLPGRLQPRPKNSTIVTGRTQPENYGGILDWINFHGAEKYVRLWMDTPADRRHLRNLELWLEVMDWSALESLELRDGV